ncbi:MAG TPA: hypothetical protein VI306_25120 [Pyrinomonadaceae bacterium]
MKTKAKNVLNSARKPETKPAGTRYGILEDWRAAGSSKTRITVRRHLFRDGK